MTSAWKAVWDRRQLDPARGSALAQLMAADGLDTGFGNVDETGWTAFTNSVAQTLDVKPGDRVFEVGCGAGAFLHDWSCRGVSVAGIDQSAALVGYARQAMPDGRFDVADAADTDPREPFDVVVACGVFLYFPSYDYARDVLKKMASKATRSVAILDVPDLSKRDAAMALRRATVGPDEYEARYAGLDHLFYSKEWMREAFDACGLRGVRVEDQQVPGYANAAFRFNVFGFRK